MVKTIKIPWAVWKEPEFLDLTFPESWNVVLCSMNNAPDLIDDEIRDGVLKPIGTQKLSDLAKGKKNAVIVVDDTTRITPVSRVIPHVIEELEEAGITKDNITILLAIGAHRPMNRQDCINKLGKKICETINIENHHPYENLTHVGESKIGTPIDINTTYYNAELKISLGGVIPHPIAGFGGGAKIVLPGVCGIRTLEANHSAPDRLGISSGVGEITELRKDIEDIAGIVGLDYSINVVLTENGGIAGVFSGHFIEAHRKAVDLCQKVYETKLSQFENDVCFFNLYPEDSELNQSSKGFNFIRMAPQNLLSLQNGTIVLLSSSHEGRGYHSLIAETGAKLYNDPKKRKGFPMRIFFFSPNISEQDLYHFYQKDMKLFNDWDNLIEELKQLYKDDAKVTIIPTSIQIPEIKRNP
jgi:nickel-dependent lactate racemase